MPRKDIVVAGILFVNWNSALVLVGKLEVLRCLDPRPVFLKRRLRAALFCSASKLSCFKLASTLKYCIVRTVNKSEDLLRRSSAFWKKVLR